MAEAKPFTKKELERFYFEYGSEYHIGRLFATITARDRRIEELEIFDGNDGHPENRCEKCRGRNLHNWYADNDVWNRVIQDKWSVLCPNCFVELAREAGIDPASWRISIPSDDSEIGKCHVKITELKEKRIADEERFMGYTKDWAEQKRKFQKRIEELEEYIQDRQSQPVYDEGYQNGQDAMSELVCKKLRITIAAQTAEIERLRGALEKTVAGLDDIDQLLAQYNTKGACMILGMIRKSARQALDAGKEK